tara:strand:+ start:3553 stop:3720 length:168 start_codon:yes stop_codon:yes gene_type:complete
MQEEVIKIYKAAGYAPEKVVEELAGLLGASLLALKTSGVEYNDNTMTVKIEVNEK